MSKSTPGPAQLLQDLEHLSRLATEIGQESKRDAETRRQREGQLRLRTEAAEKTIHDWFQGEQALVVSSQSQALQEAEARFQQRQARLREAQRNARRAGIDRLEAEEGRRKFELQRDMLRATRERDAGLAAAEAAFASATAALDSHEHTLSTEEAEARRLLGVYGSALLRPLNAGQVVQLPSPATTADLAEKLATVRADLARIRGSLANRLSRAWPLWLAGVLSPVLIIPALGYAAVQSPTTQQVVVSAAGLAVLGPLLHLVGRALALPRARAVVENLLGARALLQLARSSASETHHEEKARLEAALTGTTQRSNDAWSEVLEWLEKSRADFLANVDSRAARATRRNEQLLPLARQRIEARHRLKLSQLEAERLRRRQEALGTSTSRESAVGDEIQNQAQRLAQRWRSESQPILTAWSDFIRAIEPTPAASSHVPTLPWTIPQRMTSGFRFGRISVHTRDLLAALPETLAKDSTVPPVFELPLLLGPPDHGSLLLETAAHQRTRALDTLNHVICRLLAGSPPGRLALTLFDPVGLGQSFSALTHLADETAHLINGRVWTQSTQIEERLLELNDHLEKVIQMYLRDEYATIAEYNEQAGNIAEKHHYLVLADFPAGFTDVALRRLLNLAASGARCGVQLLIHWDRRQPLPSDFPIAALRQACVWVGLDNPAPTLHGRGVAGATIELDPAPDADALSDFIRQVARANLDSNRVEVPFQHIAPSEPELWSGDSGSELRVPIGRTGATKFQMLALGKATRQHALVAGKTGSGKSTLFHVLITNLSLWYRPDQVEFYLIDFKKGVEFKCYATHQLPHARVVAIESDREFGLSVLQRLDEELRQRGERFRAAGVQDLAAYRASPAATPMPRTLLLVDEFQEFFVEEDRVAQNASVLLDRIVRQGRAFGIHVILGSQTLGGAYTVARSTLGQMVVRIALQCSEADAILIMDEDNSAPRLLSRPGEGIYNDAGGAKAGNSPFQVVWLPDEVRDQRLRQIRELAERQSGVIQGPLVFEGDAPAEVRDNEPIRRLLAAPSLVPASSPRLWLGAPNTIKGPTELVLARRAGDHLLVVGQRDDAMLSMIGTGLIALAAQHTRGSASFLVLDGSAPDSTDRAFLDRVVAALPHEARVARGSEIGPAVTRLGEALRSRTAGTNAGPATSHYLIVHSLQNMRVLRPEDEFAFGSQDGPPAPSVLFKELIHEGAAHGFHVLAGLDTYNNVMRCLGRKTLSEFSYRVLFQMSANDSASLADNPVASRLGFHRAALYLDREGTIEIFRPYALPEAGWISGAARELTRLTPPET